MASGTQSVGRTGIDRGVLRTRGLAVAGAVGAAVAVWLLADPVLGADMTITQPGRAPLEIGLGPVLFMSLVSALLGWASLTILERLTTHGTLIWTLLALIVLTLSFFPVVGVVATGGARVALALMHVAVAVVLIPMFWRTRTRPAR